jgi:hypothetical protein
MVMYKMSCLYTAQGDFKCEQQVPTYRAQQHPHDPHNFPLQEHFSATQNLQPGIFNERAESVGDHGVPTGASEWENYVHDKHARVAGNNVPWMKTQGH